MNEQFLLDAKYILNIKSKAKLASYDSFLLSIFEKQIEQLE